MTPNHRLRSLLTSLLLLSPVAQAAQGGTSAGLTLKEASGGRPAALGEAVTAMTDDITAFSYNPASLESLKTSQASFFYRSGLANDTYGQLSVGSPLGEGSVGLSVGYFSAGDFDMNDGVNHRTANAQRDLSVGLGYSFYIGRLDLGFTGKYLTSALAETESATAFAADAGFQLPLSSRVRLGGAIQNLGTKLTYRSEGEDLPTLIRSGVAVALTASKSAPILSLDGLYDVHASNLSPALGFEKPFGPLAFRAGYRTVHGAQRFTAGLGIAYSAFTLDYAIGMGSELNSMHTLSITSRFPALFFKEGPRRESNFVVRKREQPSATPVKLADAPRPVYQAPTLTGSYSAPRTPKSRVYIVKDGDTWESIARMKYGHSELWRTIYNANAFLLGNSTALVPGQKLMVPE